jgi:hypothetical protein
MENMFPDYLEKIREAAAAGTCEGKDHYGYGVKDCQIPQLVMLVRLAADSPIYAEAIASLVESSRSVRFVPSRTLLHGHWDDTIVCGQFLFISFPDSVAKSFHHGGGPVLAVVCSQRTVSVCCCSHRCTVGQRVESEPFCSQELFYIVLPDCSLHTSYTFLHEDAPQKCCNSLLYQSLFTKCCENVW